MQGPLAEMMAQHARTGCIAWIGRRPARKSGMEALERVRLEEAGPEGDHARPGKRALTLIQAEHLPVIGALTGQGAPDPALLRRNLVVEGINLAALRGVRLALGAAVVEITGPCAPCSRMETALGPGGYNAMRGHGGWCARVLVPGEIALGDPVAPA